MDQNVPLDPNIPEVHVSTYKGKQVLNLPTGSHRFPYFSFGVGKAKMILKHLKSIEDFVKKYDTGDNDTSV